MIRNHNLNGMQFSTHDRDNDKTSRNCAVSYRGGWWYNNCAFANLNGQYLHDQSTYAGLVWHHFNATASRWRTLRYSDMKLRRS